MHRNTFLLVIFLAVFATLVIFANVVNRESNPTTTVQSGNTDKNLLQTSPSPTNSQIGIQIYSNSFCGFSFLYPASYTLREDATGSASMVEASSGDTILMTCQKDIPRPPLPPSNIDTIPIATRGNTSTISASLYHDSSPKDGSRLDVLIFYNTRYDTDVFIAGYGETFLKILKTITVL